MSFLAVKGATAYRAPYCTLTRVPGCCSAGLIKGVSSMGCALHDDPKTKIIVPPAVPIHSTDEKMAALIGYGGRLLTEDGATLCLDWLFMWRVENSAHPYKHFDALKEREVNMMKEPGRYFWPSKSWCMYDRTDLKEKAFNTTKYGYHLETLPPESGVLVQTFDAESVHAKGIGYTSFGSEKKDGYGTIRNWLINLHDVKQFREYLQPRLDDLVSQIEFEHKTNTVKSTGPEWA